jgi:hypothetical protein
MGGAVYADPDTAMTTDHLWVQYAVALGGTGGDALGGAIDLLFLDTSGSIRLRHCTLPDNQAVGGYGDAARASAVTVAMPGAARSISIQWRAPLSSTRYLRITALSSETAARGRPAARPAQASVGAIFNAGSLVNNRRTKFSDDFASTAADDIYGPFHAG